MAAKSGPLARTLRSPAWILMHAIIIVAIVMVLIMRMHFYTPVHHTPRLELDAWYHTSCTVFAAEVVQHESNNLWRTRVSAGFASAVPPAGLNTPMFHRPEYPTRADADADAARFPVGGVIACYAARDQITYATPTGSATPSAVTTLAEFDIEWDTEHVVDLYSVLLWPIVTCVSVITTAFTCRTPRMAYDPQNHPYPRARHREDGGALGYSSA